MVLAGSVFPTEPITITPETLVRRVLTLRGLHNYLPQDLAEALGFLVANQKLFPFARLVSKSFILESTESAFEFATEAQPVRVAVRPS